MPRKLGFRNGLLSYNGHSHGIQLKTIFLRSGASWDLIC